MTVLLEGAVLKSKEALHETLACALHLPPWYGGNLDALYDCLTDFHEDVEIRLVNEAALREHLGNYALLLEKVLQRAANDNALIGWAAE